MIELVALDMAGTTIEEGGAVYAALRATVEAAGAVVADEQLQRWMGTDKREAIAGLLAAAGVPPAGADTVDALYKDFRDRLIARYAAEPPRPLPGVEAALATLRAGGVRVALTTGFARDVADPLLAGLGWTAGPAADGGTVDAVVTVDEVAAGRPAPYLIFRAMELTGVHAVARVLAAGDTVADLQAGTNAGCAAVVGVLTGAGDPVLLSKEPHTHLLPGVAELPALVAALRAS